MTIALKVRSHNISYCYEPYSAQMVPSIAALEVGRVIRMIRVTRVTFCTGQVGLIRFIKYPGLTQIRSRDRTLCTNSILLIKTT